MLKLDNHGLSGGLNELSFPQLDARKAHTSLELKMCEYCPRNFTRSQGSSRKYCEACAVNNKNRNEVRTKAYSVRYDAGAGAKVISLADWRSAVEDATAEAHAR